jgi:hypothetical protein
MEEVKDCPRCGLVNPPTAQRCDCGYDFASRTVQSSYLTGREAARMISPSAAEVVACVVVPVIGLILGLRARARGRVRAGNTMLAISGVVLGVWGVIRLLVLAAGGPGL